MITTSNVAPRQVAKLNELCMAGKLLDAQALALALDELMAAPFLDTGPIPIKCMMKLMGLMATNEHRLPMVAAAPELERELAAIVERNRLAVTVTASAPHGAEARTRTETVS
jgi:4-hydroxy-tetrahydrodipicolinate synthase